jgi:hypothetical protein
MVSFNTSTYDDKTPQNLYLVGLAASHGQTIKVNEIIGSALDPAAQLSNSILTVKTLLTPLENDQVKFVRCLGLNYSDHAVSLLSFNL